MMTITDLEQLQALAANCRQTLESAITNPGDVVDLLALNRHRDRPLLAPAPGQ